MELRPYKFQIVAVAQQVDANGTVVGEVASDPVIVYGRDGLEQWARECPDKFAASEPKE